MRSLAPLLLPMFALAACAEFDLAGATDATSGSSWTSSTPPPGVDTGEDTSTGPLDSASGFVEPAWYAIDVQLRLVYGVPDPATSVVRVQLLDDALSPVCAQDLPILAVGSPTPPVMTTPALGWWSFDLDQGVPAGPCTAWPARSLALGLAPYDPRLDPAMDAHGLLGSPAYSLLLQEGPKEAVLIVGYATSASLLDGLASPVDAAPLPDDAYEAHSLLALAAP